MNRAATPARSQHGAVEPKFLSFAGTPGRRFVVHHRPVAGPVLGTLLYVHPFAEEMNKSRRMAALQSRAFARAGLAVLQIDLLGCGDSDGEFSEAGWDDWVQDIVCAARWLAQQHGAPLTLWGLRTGCLLAAEAARRLDSPAQLLFWQPVVAGTTALAQFLRLRLAAELDGGSAKGLVEALRADLAAGRSVDIAGYRISPALANGLERATLRPEPRADRVGWIELSTRADAVLLPASATIVERWRAAGHRIDTAVVQGPAFWHSVETEQAPALLDASLAAVTMAAAV